jgi:hypothetical protein
MALTTWWGGKGGATRCSKSNAWFMRIVAGWCSSMGLSRSSSSYSMSIKSEGNSPTSGSGRSFLRDRLDFDVEEDGTEVVVAGVRSCEAFPIKSAYMSAIKAGAKTGEGEGQTFRLFTCRG